ncbi:hypothetical protein MAELSTROM_45 [Pseudoalteromonas phage Maelstrom]|uniref:hypothetical protein n=1 Tax=Pseudoalteromonas phage Maelstrom TaxID=2065202 RepID=UPI000CA3040E|nr:hypothetical protein PP584_gp45 [Pseudoalteromonas phage Maelstrom]AUG84964.1 hypothetical protein MAELSTROM_45 [Pseudoalteromonas phage Maelstrom]
MRAIKVDKNRNPIIISGKFVWIYDVDVVLQNCDQAMRQQRGELNFDADKGIQYTDNVFTGNPNFQRFESQARSALSAVNGVNGIVSFNFEFNDNVLSYTTVISTIYGQTTVANQI